MAAATMTAYTDDLAGKVPPHDRKDITISFRLESDDPAVALARGTRRRLHCTITYLGENTQVLTGDGLAQFLEHKVWKNPVRLHATLYAEFGPSNNIPVWRLEFEDEAQKAVCDTFHQRFGVPSPDMQVKRATPNYHVSFKTDRDVVAAIASGTLFRASAIDVERLGPNEPFLSVSLPDRAVF